MQRETPKSYWYKNLVWSRRAKAPKCWVKKICSLDQEAVRIGVQYGDNVIKATLRYTINPEVKLS